jgi:hypothetical protein
MSGLDRGNSMLLGNRSERRALRDWRLSFRAHPRLRVCAGLLLAILIVIPGVARRPALANRKAHTMAIRPGERAPQGPIIALPDLAVLEYPLPTANSGPYGIVEGPDGNMWITEELGNNIARMTPDGTFTEFPIPTADSLPFDIARGPDGNLWFAEAKANKIGKVTISPAGAVSIAEFALPTPGAVPFVITPGPDGNVWFTELQVDQIGRITPGGIITEFVIPTHPASPYGIIAGPDGNLWFTEFTANNIGRVTPTGTFTEFPIPTAQSGPFGIAAASTGELWFTEQDSGKIGSITWSGEITEFPTDSDTSQPSGIVSVGSSDDGVDEDNEVEDEDEIATTETGVDEIGLFHGRNLPGGAEPHGICPLSIPPVINNEGKALRSCSGGPGCKGNCLLYGAAIGTKDDWMFVANQGVQSENDPKLEYRCFCIGAVTAAAGRIRPETGNHVTPAATAAPYDPIGVSIPTARSGAYVIASGPGGRFFTESASNKIGRIVRSISINPRFKQTSVGTAGTFTLKDLAVAGPVNLSATLNSTDSSVTAGIAPASVNQGESATLTVNTTANTPPGTYAITVTATSADGFRIINAVLTVVGPDFSLAISPAMVTGTRGSKVPVTVDIARTGGFTGSVTVTVPRTPVKGFKLPPGPLSTTGNSVLFKFKVKASAKAGSYPFTFTGTDSTGRSRAATVNIVVN